MSIPRFSKKNLLVYLCFALFYLLAAFFTGIRSDHFIVLGLITAAYFVSQSSRHFVGLFIFFILFGIIYDALRIYPNYLYNPIHLLEPYQIEKSWFGIDYMGNILTPNEFLMFHKTAFLDFISGAFYLLWVPLPMAYGLYLFFKDRNLLLQFSLSFLLVNLAGFVVYYLYPAAPPWYLELYGNKIDFSIAGNAAGLLRFDSLIGFPIFEDMYTKNSNVFAAMPSLHAAYPMILFYYSLKRKNKWLSAVFFSVIIGIWFAAVYSFHHYIIDLLAGAMLSISVIGLVEIPIISKGINHGLKKYLNFIHSL